MADEKRMRLRFAGACRVCGASLPARSDAIYERTTKTVRCAAHRLAMDVEPEPEEVAIDPGVPGASARREFDRRKAGRERRLRSKHPRLGGILHRLSDEPQSTTAWDTGAIGEERLGGRLNEFSSDRLRVLHDRRVPGTRANIDHLAVTPTGIYVVDAKKYAGRPHLKAEGGLIRARTETLMVGSRNCANLVDGVIKQVDVVVGVVGSEAPVHGVLCFVEADWPLIGGSFMTRDVSVLWPKKLYPQLRADGPMQIEKIEEIHRRLAVALVPA